ncbi:MAG: O-acetylhomoserine aminocarboxypropyltransferase/cysteine synthase [Oscillospiraceae bacterium]|nr:O-acetylhomoserine aminocarboxypropyltransferase/cysteine synthase [Oscillospiraceae bacterium]
MSNKIDTVCLHSGYQPKNGEPRTNPIIQSTTWRYDSSESMAALFDLSAAGYFYTRLANPTNDNVAAKICALEGGAAAILTSSGQAATFYSLFNICSAGDHIVCSSALYGGTFNLIAVTMKRMGIESTFVHPDAPIDELNAAFRPNTRAVFAESLSNPSVIVLDFDKFAAAAHSHGVPLIVDNTFPTPVNCRPFEHGVDIVVHSTTKYMDGHATSVGGAIVDSGNFDWEAHADKYPGLTTPDESYHGVTYTKDFGKGAYITKTLTQLMRDMGSIPAPMNSFLLGTHLETLHLRMKRHCENAKAVAEYLKGHPQVSWISFPGLESDKYYGLAQKYMPGGTCGVIAFGVRGGKDKKAARKKASDFQDALRLCYIATHVADARTCLLYPAGTTHRQMTDEQLEAAGVSHDLIRLSVGLEDPDDIIADLTQAFDAVKD